MSRTQAAGSEAGQDGRDLRYGPSMFRKRRLLELACFQQLRLLKFDDKPCFQRDGVAMREMQLEGYKPPV